MMHSIANKQKSNPGVQASARSAPLPSASAHGMSNQRLLQRRAAAHEAPATVPPIVHDVLRSPGQPLDAGTRADMEPRFGHDFSQVRVHTDARAAESARAVNAHAYTVGSHIVFGAQQFSPGTAGGQNLLAHELTHTIQQSASLQTKGGIIVQRREAPQEEMNEDAAAATDQEDELASTTDVAQEAEEESQDNVAVIEQQTEEKDAEAPAEAQAIESCKKQIDGPLTEVGRETDVEELPAAMLGGDGDRPNRLKFRFWLIRYLNPKYWGPSGKDRFICDFQHKAPYRPATGGRQRYRHKLRKRTNKERKREGLFECVTEYKVDQTQIVAGHQPEVKNKETNQDFSLDNGDCVYLVRWDMEAIPDRIIITDNKTKQVLKDTGMKPGTGQQLIRGAANIHIRVVPNDGTGNPNHSDTVYHYDITAVCGDVIRTTTCYLWGVPIGRTVQRLPFNPNAKYIDKTQRSTFSGARKLLKHT